MVLGVHTLSSAKRGSLRAIFHALSVMAYLVIASDATGAAVKRIGHGVHAAPSALCGSRGTILLALAVRAYFVRGAGVVTGTAMVGVGGQVDAGAAAIGQARAAFRLALAQIADRAGIADGTDATTMARIAEGIDQFSAYTEHARVACVPAGTTVLRVVRQVGARTLATGLSRNTLGIAVATVYRIRVRIHAIVSATNVAIRAGLAAKPVRTDFTRGTALSAFPAMVLVHLQIDASPVAHLHARGAG
jgi:hypothetical protein